MSMAYLNGDYMPLKDCKISVLDRGFIFGDAIYELIPVYKSNPFYLEAHLLRLARSMDQVGIVDPHSTDEWKQIINKLIEQSGLEQLSVYLQVTRGVAKRDHAFPANTAPTVFGMTNQWPAVNNDIYEKGLTAVTTEDIRWNRCDIKVTSLLSNVMEKQHAVDNNADEAILIRDGYVLEGSATNVFVVKEGQVMTAPKNNLILPGVTRDVVIEVLKENNIPLQEKAPTQEQLANADEVWITSSTKECAPVTAVDRKSVGNGKPGEVWQKVFNIYQARK
ncbi:MAG: D-amino-acid transaminase [Gammaproteobacteria bacterium]|nr:D-amino-acid transaminase [Gammaproteobacteria bacterium]